MDASRESVGCARGLVVFALLPRTVFVAILERGWQRTSRRQTSSDYETPSMCPMNHFRPTRHHVRAILAVLRDDFLCDYPEDEATADRCRRALDVFDRWITSERERLAKCRSD
jgi:hypothetical protein